MSRRVTMVTDGLLPRLHCGIVWSLAQAARPFNYRGVQRLSWELTRVLPADDTVAVRLAEDTRVLLPLGDGYWTKLLNRHYEYEPEVAALLSRYVDEDTYFLDCGANIGYWSLLTRSKARKVVAVEASPATFTRLTANVALNSATDVTLVNAALWESDGDELSIAEDARLHAGAAITGTRTGAATEGSSAVRSVTLRTLIQEYFPDKGRRIFVKLDVEGAEVPAIRGAGSLLRERDVIIAYEDHGGDPSCKVTRYLQQLGMVTADPATGSPLTLEQVAATKTLPWKGYNFLAYDPGRPNRID